MSEAEFSGRTAVVTGAARGLGLAVSASLAARGCQVCMTDIDAAGLTEAARRVKTSGGKVLPVPADVTDETALVTLRGRVLDWAGHVDILVNNVGAWRYRKLREITVKEWDETFAVNVRSVFLATRAFMDLMAERRYGRIVNVASGAAYRARPDLPDYAAAKAAVVSLTRSFAAELAPHQILVNAVCPTIIATEAALSQADAKARAASIPLGRIADPGDVAEVVLFLASDRNRFMAGENVLVSGGSLMM